MKNYILSLSLISLVAISCNKSASTNTKEAILARTGLSTPSSDLKRAGLVGKVKSVSTIEYEARIMFGEITPVRELEYDSVFYDESGFTLLEYNKDYEHNRENSTLKEYNYDHYITKNSVKRTESGYSITLVDTYFYDEYNHVIESIFPNYEGGTDTIKNTYQYDEYGRVLEKKSSNERVIYQYNRLGYILESKTYEKDSLIEEISNVYFQDSLLQSSKRIYNGNTFTTEIEYNSLGHRLKETKTGGIMAGVTVYHPDGIQVRTTDEGDVYETGKNYEKTRRPKLTESAPIEEYHEYDQWGNKLKTEYTWYYSGVYGPHYIYSTTLFEYQYDKHHNWIKEARYRQNRGKEKILSSYTIRRIEYYE